MKIKNDEKYLTRRFWALWVPALAASSVVLYMLADRALTAGGY